VRRRARLAAAALVAAALAGCGGVQRLSYPTPRPTLAPVVTTVPTLPANLAAAPETPVAGALTSAPPMIGPGQASLNGTVIGPNGPVGGATVEADRLVGDQVASVKTTTAADGSWNLSSVLGGRYRVRAWQQPSLALTTPQIFFLAGTQSHTLTLQLTAFTGPVVASAFAPADPVEGQSDNLVIQVTNPTVGSDGVVRDLPDAGVSVTLTDGPRWVVSNGNPLPTDSSGQVLFQVSCQAAGSLPLSAEVGTSTSVGLELPDCAPPPATTLASTTTTPSPSTNPTSTTCPPVSTSHRVTTSPSGSC
jgi:Carboxypeptidase regulatory-like domain